MFDLFYLCLQNYTLSFDCASRYPVVIYLLLVSNGEKISVADVLFCDFLTAAKVEKVRKNGLESHISNKNGN